MIFINYRFKQACSLFLLIFVIIAFLYSETESKLELLYLALESSLNELDYDPNSTFYLHLDFLQTDELNSLLLQNYLIKKINLVEMEQFADYSVNISVEEALTTKPRGSLFRKKEQYIVYSFMWQIIRNADARIMQIHTLEIEEAVKTKIITKDSWYHPVIIAFILGSLVYLLFYGNG